jgi:quercetin dioxygenase-like cupin family protein
MEMNDLAASFDGGKVICTNRETESTDLSWNPHPKFPGVFLKHLVTGADTENRFSSHLIRVSQGCEIGDHIHATQYELHQVVSGKGRCQIPGKEIVYTPGICAVIPEGISHKVTAEGVDLYLLAIFMPCLL